MSAAFKFNNKLVKEVLKAKNTKFAELKQVWEITVSRILSIFNIQEML